MLILIGVAVVVYLLFRNGRRKQQPTLEERMRDDEFYAARERYRMDNEMMNAAREMMQAAQFCSGAEKKRQDFS